MFTPQLAAIRSAFFPLDRPSMKLGRINKMRRISKKLGGIISAAQPFVGNICDSAVLQVTVNLWSQSHGTIKGKRVMGSLHSLYISD